jgi:hypothetical protein
MKRKHRKTEIEKIEGVPPNPLMGISAIEGAVAGAVVGAFAGPVGAIVGGALGSMAGIAAGAALEDAEEARSQHDHELDREIGVEGGEIGHANPNMPPPRIGAFSAGSCGAGGRVSYQPSAGPMQDDADD